jgi:hypothetical protein
LLTARRAHAWAIRRIHHATLLVHLLPALLHLTHVLLHHWALFCRDVTAAFERFAHGSHLFLHVSELRLQLLDLRRSWGGLLSQGQGGKAKS